jgi:hypothetical protein
VLLLRVQLVPVSHITREVKLLNGPETGDLLFIHAPDIVVLEWEENEPMWVLFEEWLFNLLYLHRSVFGNHLFIISRL